MDHFAGLDVSVKETSVCIVDDTGRIVREVKVESEPDALLAVLKNPTYHFKRIGLEAGPLSQWLFSALADTEYWLAAFEAALQSHDAAAAAELFLPDGLWRDVLAFTWNMQTMAGRPAIEATLRQTIARTQAM